MRGRTHLVPHRRRREGKTDYKQRLRMLKSGKRRLCVRRSLNNITCQIVQYKPDGDVTLVSSDSKELKKFGWSFHKGNIPSAYLTGYLCGLRAKKNKIENCILDEGLYSSIKGSRIYAVLKGAVDSGLKIPHSKEILPPEDRVKGKHTSQPEKMAKDFEKASEYFNSSLKQSANNSDSSQVYKYKGDLHRQEGVSRLTQADSTEAGESFRLSIDNYLKAYDSDSTKLIALSYTSFIYHEYLYNFEKAFKYAKILYDKNPKNLIYAINFAEISMTSGEIDSSFNIAKSYLTQDLEKKIKLPNNYKMTLKFLIVCTEILRKKYLNAYKEFGSLQKNYIKYDSWQTIGWTWNGTRHFLNSQLEGDYKNILLKTLDALSLPKNEGLIELNEIDVKWTKLLE